LPSSSDEEREESKKSDHPNNIDDPENLTNFTIQDKLNTLENDKTPEKVKKSDKKSSKIKNAFDNPDPCDKFE